MKKFYKVIKNPFLAIYFLDKLKVTRLLSDRIYLKIRYRACFKKKLNLSSPQTYTEKLQWIKIYDHNSKYTKMVDKYLVKEYVARLIGEQYIIPTIGVWDKVEDIPFDKLPNSFVLKCTHDSGGLVVVKDKSVLDIEQAKKKLKSSLNNNYYWVGREWPYKNVKPRIIAEKYMEDSITGELRDYKFFVFNGKAKALFIATDRQNTEVDTAFDFFDMNFNHLDIRNGHPNSSRIIKKPQSFFKMKELAEKLGKGMPEARIDFYEVDGNVYFGEITLFHHSGFTPFEPERWDYIFGKWISLPMNTK